MPALSRTVIFIALMLTAAAATAARPLLQQSKESKEPTATVAGLVTIGGKPAPNVTVMLLPHPAYNSQAAARGSTDEEGRFRLTRIPAGRYSVYPFTPALISDSEGPQSRGEMGGIVILSDGDSVEGIKIALKRGGVITGRITDANGRPVIEQQVWLQLMGEGDNKQPFYPPNNHSLQTDDRGVYRIYGLPAGRYLVGIGVEPERGVSGGRNGNRYYPLTFHPGVTDQSKATVVELSQGGEVTGVDIILGRVEKGYAATGRIVNADTGKPLADVSYGYGVSHSGRVSYSTSGFRSNAKGEFRLEGLLPGSYKVFATPGEGNEYYSEPTAIEIVDADVRGVEMKVRRGSSISGTLVVEGASNQDISAKLAGLFLYVSMLKQEANFFGGARVKINLDGSFRVSGLSPGKAVFRVNDWERKSGLALLRVERDGLEQSEGVELSAGEQVSGVKVIFTLSTGIIRGQIKVEGMDNPNDALRSIQLRRVGEHRPEPVNSLVDARGRFILEGIAPGEYELTATCYSSPPHRPLKSATQIVTVTNGAESEVTFVLKIDAKDN
jgi:hypothetical protein